MRVIDAAVVALLAATLWALDTAAGAGTNPLEYVRYGIILGLDALILLLVAIEALRRPLTLELSAGGALFGIFLLYTVVSVLWSAGGMQSVLKVILLAAMTSTALAIAVTRPTETIVRSVAIVCGAYVVLGALAAIFVPSIGIETGWQLEGKWRGISAQKNGFGAVVAISLVFAAIQLIVPRPEGHRRGPLLLTVIWIGFLLFCLAMAGSRGAQLTATLGIAGLIFTRMGRSTQNVIIFGSVLLAIPLAILAVLTFSADSTQLSVFGLTFDTSSRTQIWAYGLELLPGRELFGYGPSGFWTPERADVFEANNGWVLDNFHSGYVTALMEGGAVGLLLLLASLFASFAALRHQASGAAPSMVSAFAFFCIVAVQNVVENTFGRSTDFLFFTFLLFTFSAVSVAPLPSRERQASRPHVALSQT